MSCNVVKVYVDFVSKNFDVYTKKIMGKFYDKDLFDKYIRCYVNVRYYNQCVSVRTTLEANLNYYLNEVYGKNNNKTSKFILELFKMYYYLDGVKKFNYEKDLKKFVGELNDVRENKLGIVDKSFETKFCDLILDNMKRMDKYIDSFDSKDFYLERNYYEKKEVTDIDIFSNVSIPKLYSSYAINKVWNSVVISENSLQICYYLINQEVLKNVINGNFNSKYIVPFKSSLFSKKDKIKRVLEIMNNDISRDLISLKINYDEFVKNKDDVYKLIHDGYSFSVILDDTFSKDGRGSSVLDIFEYIIVTDISYKNAALVGRKNVIYL